MSDRILVVDDQESMRLLLCSALRGLGYEEIIVARDGLEALKIARGRMLSAILLDVEMPILNGFDTLREIRVDPQLSGMPVIMVTARADASFVQRIKPLEPSGYLIKPVTGAALGACLDRVLASSHSKDHPA